MIWKSRSQKKQKKTPNKPNKNKNKTTHKNGGAGLVEGAINDVGAPAPVTAPAEEDKKRHAADDAGHDDVQNIVAVVVVIGWSPRPAKCGWHSVKHTHK